MSPFDREKERFFRSRPIPENPPEYCADCGVLVNRSQDWSHLTNCPCKNYTLRCLDVQISIALFRIDGCAEDGGCLVRISRDWPGITPGEGVLIPYPQEAVR